jgi:hypothetical protein
MDRVEITGMDIAKKRLNSKRGALANIAPLGIEQEDENGKV